MVPTMLEKVLSCSSLPSLPNVAIEVIELTRAENVKFSEIEAVVLHDPALAGKILKTVNSSYYGLSEPCPTIGRALKYLGLNTVKSLVLGFSLVDLTRREGSSLDLMDYWQRSLSSAAAARRLAQACRSCDPDEAFVAALMQDIGMLAMITAIEAEYVPVLDSIGRAHDRLPAAEQAALGFDHAEAGARLAERWRLPEQIAAPIRNHHREALEDAPPIVRIVALAYRISCAVCGAAVPGALGRLAELAARWLNLPEADLKALMIATAEDSRQLSGQFKVAIGALPDMRSILANAEEAMVAHQLRMQREAQQLQRANEQLSRQAHTDGLTGVGNRTRFDEVLIERFEQARAEQGCLGLILADVDRFKLLNDTYGHQAGDAVLVELAQRLEEGAGNVGLVCRYGGEEFAVILAGAARVTVAQIAEALRQSIAAEPFDVSNVVASVERIDVTASFGVAGLDPTTSTVFRSPQVLTRAADKALYAAKQAGRNCVRVFRPRVTQAA